MRARVQYAQQYAMLVGNADRTAEFWI